MDQQMPPRVKLQTDVTQAEYVQASLLLARRFGALQLSPAAMVTGVLLIAAGIYCLCNQDVALLSAGLLLGIFLLLSGVAEIVVFAAASGVMLGSACMVDGMIDRMEEELGGGVTVVATGGIARFVLPMCRRRIEYDRDLLLKGLSILYENNRREK